MGACAAAAAVVVTVTVVVVVDVTEATVDAGKDLQDVR